MPRENRKRGKKHKQQVKDAEAPPEPQSTHIQDEETDTLEAGPSWIIPARQNAVDLNAPFGFVDTEVKAYFRTVDLQIREWQDTRAEVEENEDVDPNEDRRMFFVAALTEMSGKERQLATDPDCSTIMERMVHSMDDFARRVFLDTLCGSFEQLSKHRFASHVLQTLFTCGGDTVSREARGILPPMPESQEDVGELRTFTQLTLDFCNEIMPQLSSLVMDSFASHVIRALLLLLAPNVLNASNEGAAGKVRSKKSATYKARQGAMKSVFADTQEQAQRQLSKRVPKEFRQEALRIVTTFRDSLGGNEVRALAANSVASPVLQMLLELEAAYGLADAPGSLMDNALVGLISAIHENPDAIVPESDYLTTLLRDPTASHLLETLVRKCPDSASEVLWRTYFSGKLSKLAVHPVANFVVAKAIERLSSENLASAMKELEVVGGKIVKNSRIGVFNALVNRASALQAGAEDINELLCHSFELDSEDRKTSFVPCVLRLKTYDEYQRALASASKREEEVAETEPSRKRQKTDDPLEPKTQGAVLLQAMLRLPSPHNDLVLRSVQALPIEKLIEMAQHPTSSRVLDALLDSPTVPPKARRALITAFLGHFPALVDDRIGSRVGDRCWAAADPYLREKIARSVAPHEHALAGSFYGKFFARNLSLHVLQRDPERWRSMQVASKAAPAADVGKGGVSAEKSSKPSIAVATSVKTDNKRTHEDATHGVGKAEKGKRKARHQDEIDALFDATLGKKVKKAELVTDAPAKAAPEVRDVTEDARKGDKKKKSKRKRDKDEDGGAETGLEDVLGAIRAAPREEKGSKKRKKAH